LLVVEDVGEKPLGVPAQNCEGRMQLVCFTKIARDMNRNDSEAKGLSQLARDMECCPRCRRPVDTADDRSHGPSFRLRDIARIDYAAAASF
jgi:hypothetical protein